MLHHSENKEKVINNKDDVIVSKFRNYSPHVDISFILFAMLLYLVRFLYCYSSDKKKRIYAFLRITSLIFVFYLFIRSIGVLSVYYCN